MSDRLFRIALIITLVLWTTARHEGSHALSAWLEGSTIQEMKLLPGIHPEKGFYFGYVAHSGPSTWRTDAAPFGVDALLAFAAYLWGRRLLRGSRLHSSVAFLGVLSPLIDLVYNYQGGLWRSGTDVADLLQALPSIPVHLLFLTAIVLNFLALRALQRQPTTAS